MRRERTLTNSRAIRDQALEDAALCAGDPERSRGTRSSIMEAIRALKGCPPAKDDGWGKIASGVMELDTRHRNEASHALNTIGSPKADAIKSRALVTQLRDQLKNVLWLYRGDSQDEEAKAQQAISAANSYLDAKR